VDPTDLVEVTGYHLFMDDGYNGDFTIVYNGTDKPFTAQYTAVGLTIGLPYRFKVQSENINGLSQFSEVAEIYACLKPFRLPAPTKVATTRTSITIKWQEPVANGCAI